MTRLDCSQTVFINQHDILVCGFTLPVLFSVQHLSKIDSNLRQRWESKAARSARYYL